MSNENLQEKIDQLKKDLEEEQKQREQKKQNRKYGRGALILVLLCGMILGAGGWGIGFGFGMMKGEQDIAVMLEKFSEKTSQETEAWRKDGVEKGKEKAEAEIKERAATEAETIPPVAEKEKENEATTPEKDEGDKDFLAGKIDKKIREKYGKSLAIVHDSSNNVDMTATLVYRTKNTMYFATSANISSAEDGLRMRYGNEIVPIVGVDTFEDKDIAILRVFPLSFDNEKPEVAPAFNNTRLTGRERMYSKVLRADGKAVEDKLDYAVTKYLYTGDAFDLSMAAEDKYETGALVVNGEGDAVGIYTGIPARTDEVGLVSITDMMSVIDAARSVETETVKNNENEWVTSDIPSDAEDSEDEIIISGEDNNADDESSEATEETDESDNADDGKEADAQDGILGVTVTDVPDKYVADESVPDGAVVMSVSRQADTTTKRLKKYDVITAVNGRRIRSATDLVEAVQTHKAGDKVLLTIERQEPANRFVTKHIEVKLIAKEGVHVLRPELGTGELFSEDF